VDCFRDVVCTITTSVCFTDELVESPQKMFMGSTYRTDGRDVTTREIERYQNALGRLFTVTSSTLFCAGRVDMVYKEARFRAGPTDHDLKME
jgi:hypothetical protein